MSTDTVIRKLDLAFNRREENNSGKPVRFRSTVLMEAHVPRTALSMHGCLVAPVFLK